MKTLLVATMVLAMVTGSARSAHCSIACWNFNSGSSNNAGEYSENTIKVTSGSGTLDVSNFDTEPDVFEGTVTNMPDPDPDGTGRGVGLSIRLGAAAQANNGKYMQFTLDMSGYRDLVMTYATQRSNTGFTSQEISYSTDGENFISFIKFDDLPDSFGTTSTVPGAIMEVDLSDILDLNDNPDVYLRVTLEGATHSSGNNRFDNVQFFAIPEPTTLFFMLGAAVLLALRRRRKE